MENTMQENQSVFRHRQKVHSDLTVLHDKLIFLSHHSNHRILRNPQFQCCFHKNSPLGIIMMEIISTLILTPCLQETFQYYPSIDCMILQGVFPLLFLQTKRHTLRLWLLITARFSPQIYDQVSNIFQKFLILLFINRP